MLARHLRDIGVPHYVGGRHRPIRLATASTLQGYLAHNKRRAPRTLQYPCAYGPMVALGVGAVSYERGTPLVLVLHTSTLTRLLSSDLVLYLARAMGVRIPRR